ncbi:hypothetical protein AG1IA_05321 [Rhizoctonia solani AG-1 IA]|uniref:Uncharacterized protein n=1 Tax=Thanatephorus cucumeris (strain AG1-IA) TaxID=983506 RepID=L8WR86_THACA|nr:hypothetical protein AG1IA_05321 [Rhizoctonia solani AG-1 IA]
MGQGDLPFVGVYAATVEETMNEYKACESPDYISYRCRELATVKALAEPDPRHWTLNVWAQQEFHTGWARGVRMYRVYLRLLFPDTILITQF